MTYLDEGPFWDTDKVVYEKFYFYDNITYKDYTQGGYYWSYT